MDSGRATRLAWAFAALAAVAAVGVTAAGLKMDDLHVYQLGGQAWVDDVRLYSSDFHAPLGLPFTYPPFAAMTFALLAPLPWTAAVAVVTALGVAALAASCVLVASTYVDVPRNRAGPFGLPRPTPQATALGLGVAAAGLLLEPVRSTLGYGQINLILLGLVIADCLLPKTPWPRGLLIGIAAAVKLTPAVFGLYFVASRQWRPAAVIVGTFISAHALAWAVAPRESRDYWFGALSDPARIGGLEFAGNQSVRALVHRWGVPAGTETLLWGAAVLAVVAVAWLAVARCRKTGDDVLALLATAVAGLLCSPVSWSHHWVWIAPAAVVLLVAARRAARPGVWAAVGAVLLVFAVGPQRLLPNSAWTSLAGTTPELDWAAWQQGIGASYVVLGAVFLGAVAFSARFRRALGTSPLRNVR